jgi:glutaminase
VEDLTRGAADRSRDPVASMLRLLHDVVRPDMSGEVASYIPELARADAHHFGIALVSLVGRSYDAGDASVEFTIQSISKPFVFALALAERGLEGVLERVGAEPSGDAFNAISLDPQTGRPSNPMINAGAIATTGLVPAKDSEERFGRIRATLSAFAGRELTVDEAVYRSERETGDRNRALAYLMRNAGSLETPVEEVVDVYFRQCSLRVTAVDLAVMAATLANEGHNPVTDETVVPARVAEQTCAVMASCGMYDYAGEWMLRVGLPAKSGVSGGLVAVCPGQFGIGLFSPPLDPRGNSVRAVVASQMLSERYSLQLVHRRRATTPVLSYDEHEVGDGSGAAGSVRVLTLQGDIEFASAEMVLSTVEPLRRESPSSACWLIIDLARVPFVQPFAGEMLAAMIRDVAGTGTPVVVADPMQRELFPDAAVELPSAYLALAWCGERALSAAPPPG